MTAALQAKRDATIAERLARGEDPAHVEGDTVAAELMGRESTDVLKARAKDAVFAFVRELFDCEEQGREGAPIGRRSFDRLAWFEGEDDARVSHCEVRRINAGFFNSTELIRKQATALDALESLVCGYARDEHEAGNGAHDRDLGDEAVRSAE